MPDGIEGITGEHVQLRFRNALLKTGHLRILLHAQAGIGLQKCDSHVKAVFSREAVDEFRMLWRDSTDDGRRPRDAVVMGPVVTTILGFGTSGHESECGSKYDDSIL